MGHEEAHFVDLAGPRPLGGPAGVLAGRGAVMTVRLRPTMSSDLDFVLSIEQDP